MYNFTKVEKKWQRYWNEDIEINKINDSIRGQYYMRVDKNISLENVGQIRKYIAMDIFMRVKRMQGYNIIIDNNIINKLGLSFDWNNDKFLNYDYIQEDYNKFNRCGLVLGTNNKKMCNINDNIIYIDDVISDYGVDALRMSIMFISDYKHNAIWNSDVVRGCKKYLQRVYKLRERVLDIDNYSDSLIDIQNNTVKDVIECLDNMKYNIYIAKLMRLTNKCLECDNLTKKDYNLLLQLLNPVAPHITEELNQEMGYSLLAYQEFPKYKVDKKIKVYIDGKFVTYMDYVSTDSEEELKIRARDNIRVKEYLSILEIKNIIIRNNIVIIMTK